MGAGGSAHGGAGAPSTVAPTVPTEAAEEEWKLRPETLPILEHMQEINERRANISILARKHEGLKFPCFNKLLKDDGRTFRSCVVLRCLALCCLALCCVVLLGLVLCCVVLCCVVLCCVVLCCVVLS